MGKLLYHRRLRDLRFLVLVLLNLILIGGFLRSEAGDEGGPPGGWRRVDVQALQIRIEAGELVDREASWYHREAVEKVGQDRE